MVNNKYYTNVSNKEQLLIHDLILPYLIATNEDFKTVVNYFLDNFCDIHIHFSKNDIYPEMTFVLKSKDLKDRYKMMENYIEKNKMISIKTKYK